MSSIERGIVRDLAKRYLEVAQAPLQEERRKLWRDLNSLRRTRPLIYVRAFAWHEMPEAATICQEPRLRGYEHHFRHLLCWHSLGDDSVFNPWVVVRPHFSHHGWGLDVRRNLTGVAGGSYKIDYPLKTLEDAGKIIMPRHAIDEEATADALAFAVELLGDILPVTLDRSPNYTMWSGDLATILGQLRGIENIMLDMYDNPALLQRLMEMLAQGIEGVQAEAEAAGDWSLLGHQNQAMPYAHELPDPAPDTNGVQRQQLWGFMAAQEFTAISPAMHEEFLLRYQLPILQKFGLTAYGCCEDLTQKIGMLRRIPNLRRIAVAPSANVAACAAQIGHDYVISYRPSPVDMVSYDFNPERMRRILTRDLASCRGQSLDITLKDVETVGGDPNRVRTWVSITREVINDLFG